jgi:hypothetical protein
MILTEKDLTALQESMFIIFTDKQKQIILDRFGTEPDNGYSWTEQDIAEQIRKICGQR